MPSDFMRGPMPIRPPSTVHAINLILLLGLSGCGTTYQSSPTGLIYPVMTLICTRGVPITTDTPALANGLAQRFTIAPALPEGLDFSSTGVISGTPATVTAKKIYTVTASGPGGSTTAILTLTVNDVPPPGVLNIPNLNQQISPLAPANARFEPLNPDLADNPNWLASAAVTSVLSPDNRTLLVLTSGFNIIFNADGTPNLPDCAQYVFIYDVSTAVAVKKQVLKVPNTYCGLAFDPTGKGFYVTGGKDDCVYSVGQGSTGAWAINGKLALGHSVNGVLTGNGLRDSGDTSINGRIGVFPCAAGVALSSDGQTMVVVNYYNDSVSVLAGGYGHWALRKDLDLRPGRIDPTMAGVPGGTYPFWTAIKGTGAAATAYVSSLRDREIIQVSLGASPAVVGRIAVKGQPLKMTLNAAQTLLYVVEDHTETVDVIDTASNALVETIPVVAPPGLLPADLVGFSGANANSLALAPDEKQLYVTNGNLNCVAVVALGGSNQGDQVVGLIPTGWYPTSVSFSGDGNTVFVVNAKSPTGANPGFHYSYGPAGSASGFAANAYNPQLIRAGFQSFPRPGAGQLGSLTAQVAVNNRFTSVESVADGNLMAAVRKGIQHVIFIIKENRTYDQILGDLEVGNGDPSLAQFGQTLTPNAHTLARTFTTLDNFLVAAEVSNDGWPWTTSAQAPEVIQRQWPIAYASRGLSLDSEGDNRNVNVALPTLAQRMAANPLMPADPDLLAGTTNVAAPDGPDNELNTGYLWDAALRAQLTVRNYGFFIDVTRYNVTDPAQRLPLDHDPFTAGHQVAYSASVSLMPFTDIYFRGFDTSFPDYYRYTEWARDFDTNYAKGGLPSLSLVRFMHDHTGNFALATDGVNTPETQVADNDYAVGLLVEKIAHSSYAGNTLIFVVEDDAQDGPDHVDSHRSAAFVAGPFVKQGALVTTAYNTIDFVRTIEEVLGLPPMNMNDALARPMADVFSPTAHAWSFTAVPSPILYTTTLPLPPKAAGMVVPRPSHGSAYWARVTRGMDFEEEDEFDFAEYNKILWRGLMGHKPYPAVPTTQDLRANRTALLARYRNTRTRKPQPKTGGLVTLVR